ncbi:ATP-binding protein [Streptomyces sp. NPDC045369]|uniref:ATP-binding protein n=1 Tax=Streptomyces sp. NPDC045369 TaxID=3155732 RepID=UPI0033DFA55C
MLIGHAVQMQGTGPELVERETVLATLRHLLGSLSRRRGHTVLVTGPTASGRSALLRAFAEEAAAAGASVLTSAGSPAESRLPFELVNQLLPGLRPTDGAAEHPMPAQPAGTSGADAAREVHRSVARLARTAPVVLVVDDVQHGDRESLDCLLYAVRRLERAPVMIVVSEPEQPVPGVPSVSSALLPHRRCTRLRVGPLSVDGIRTLATHRVGAVEARRPAPRLKLSPVGTRCWCTPCSTTAAGTGKRTEPEPGTSAGTGTVLRAGPAPGRRPAPGRGAPAPVSTTPY